MMNRKVWKASGRLLTTVLAASLALAAPGWGAAASDQDPLTDSRPLYELHTLAGTGEIGLVDGANGRAAFRMPAGLAAASENRLYVADTGNQRIRQVSGTSTSSLAGLDLGEDAYGNLIGAWNDGLRESAAFDDIAGLALDADGAVIAADAGNHAIRRITAEGQATTIAGNGVQGWQDGDREQASFHRPQAVAVAPGGVIYVADTLNHVIRKIEQGRVTTLTAPSSRIVEYYAGAIAAAGDYADGPIAAAKFNEPSGLALDAKGNLYVSDTGNQVIRYIDFAAGTVSTVAGSRLRYEAATSYAEGGYADGPAATARFYAPRGLAVTPEGGVLIADSLNHAIRYLKDGVVATVAGTPGTTGKSDGLAGYAGLNTPTAIAPFGDGSYAIADTANNRIRLLTPYRLPAGVTADGKLKLLYGQERVATDAAPMIVSGTTFVPVRVIAERLGYQVVHDAASGQVTVSREDLSYRLQAGAAIVQRGEGEARSDVALPAAPFIEQGRLYLPVRFFAEEIGLDVQWLSSVRAVLLRERLS